MALITSSAGSVSLGNEPANWNARIRIKYSITSTTKVNTSSNEFIWEDVKTEWLYLTGPSPEIIDVLTLKSSATSNLTIGHNTYSSDFTSPPCGYVYTAPFKNVFFPQVDEYCVLFNWKRNSNQFAAGTGNVIYINPANDPTIVSAQSTNTYDRTAGAETYWMEYRSPISGGFGNPFQNYPKEVWRDGVKYYDFSTIFNIVTGSDGVTYTRGNKITTSGDFHYYSLNWSPPNYARVNLMSDLDVINVNVKTLNNSVVGNILTDFTEHSTLPYFVFYDSHKGKFISSLNELQNNDYGQDKVSANPILNGNDYEPIHLVHITSVDATTYEENIIVPPAPPTQKQWEIRNPITYCGKYTPATPILPNVKYNQGETVFSSQNPTNNQKLLDLSNAGYFVDNVYRSIWAFDGNTNTLPNLSSYNVGDSIVVVQSITKNSKDAGEHTFTIDLLGGSIGLVGGSTTEYTASVNTGDEVCFIFSQAYVTSGGSVQPPGPITPTSPSGFNTNDVYDIQKRKTLSLRLSTAPLAVQSLRKKIIENANLMIEEMKKYNFVEYSEIVRVCTALGIKRAFLRGLKKSISSEEDIDRYIHRFNLRGALPFQDQNEPQQENWIGGGFFAEKAFAYYNDTADDDKKKTHTILLQCLTTDSNNFIRCANSTVDFLENPSERTLPLTAFIPKYREAGFDEDVPWLPFMKCSLLNNVPDTENCVSTIDISSSANELPDTNLLIPVNSNQFPYITPNAGFPYSKVVNPEPKPLRMIMDGSPIEGEEIILQNKFELTGAVKISPGDEVFVEINGPIGGVTPINGTSLEDGDTIIVPELDIEFPINLNPDLDPPFISSVTTPINYTGRALALRDPIKGEGSIFTEELEKDDIIELNFPNRAVGGSFFTTGTSDVYYMGTDFTKYYQDNIRILLSGVQYTLTKNTHLGTLDSSGNITANSIDYDGLRINYTALYSIDSSKTEIFSEQVRTKANLFKSITEIDVGGVAVIPSPTNRKIATIEFGNPNYLANTTFEIGDVVYVDDEKYRFQLINGNRLEGAYRIDNTLIDNGFNATTFSRPAKTTRALESIQGGLLTNYRMYHQVKSIVSDTEITLDPPYLQSSEFEGKIQRIGFNIKSNSESPDLKNSGFDEDGVGQFLMKSASTGSDDGNSPTFFVPAAATNKVILYRGEDFIQDGNNNAALKSMTAKDVVNITQGLNSYINVFNYQLFSFSKGIPLYPSLVDGFQEFDNILSSSSVGKLYFTDGEDPYIILETILDNNPVSHGFAAGDILSIRKAKFTPADKDDPYGDLVSYSESTLLNEFDYSHCGLEIEVADVVNPHRFKILKNGRNGLSKTNIFFNNYDKNTTHYLTATNGNALENWSKYFKPVFMDGTVTANSENEYAAAPVGTGNVSRTLSLCSKDNSASDYYFNYNAVSTSIEYKLGSTAVNIEMNGNKVQIQDGGGTTEDGTFLLSLKTPLTAPPNLMDSYLLRIVDFEEKEL